MSKRDTLQKIMNVGAGLAGAYFVGIAIAGAIKRRREQQELEKTLNKFRGVGAVQTSTGNTKTTIRDAWKKRKENFGYVIFTDVAEPKENQVWVIDGYDPSYKEYSLYNYANTSKEKFVKGDKVCFTDFYF